MSENQNPTKNLVFSAVVHFFIDLVLNLMDMLYVNRENISFFRPFLIVNFTKARSIDDNRISNDCGEVWNLTCEFYQLFICHNDSWFRTRSNVLNKQKDIFDLK